MGTLAKDSLKKKKFTMLLRNLHSTEYVSFIDSSSKLQSKNLAQKYRVLK